MIMLAIMILVIAMVLVVVNLGKVATIKTTTANAADVSALGLASSLGSMSRQLCNEIRGGGLPATPGLCHKCHFGGYLGIVLGVILIIVAIVLCLTGVGCAGGVPLLTLAGGLIVGAGLAGISLILQTAVFDTLRIDRLNSRLRRNLPPMVSLRLQTYLGALLPVIDDPHVQADTRDIDKDHNTTELVSTFAVWFDKKLDDIETEVAAKLAGEVPVWQGRLQNARNVVQQLQDFLVNELIPYFAWVEQNLNGQCVTVHSDPTDPTSPLITKCRPTIDIPIWKPGDQGRTMCLFGVPCPIPPIPNSSCHPADPDPNTGIPPGPPPGLDACDEVDFMVEDTKDFVSFADGILNISPQEQAASLNDWVDGFRSAAAVQFEQWMETVWGYPISAPVVPGWKQKLSGLDATIAAALADPDLGIPPPPGGETLGQLMTELDGILHTLQGIVSDLKHHNLTPVDVPVEDQDFIYPWQDKRGCHVVGAEVSHFKLPRSKIERSFTETCVEGENVTGSVTVTVRRFDQDQHINQLWDMKTRNNPQAPAPGAPCDKSALQFGISSTSTAAYGFKQHAVQVKDAK